MTTSTAMTKPAAPAAPRVAAPSGATAGDAAPSVAAVVVTVSKRFQFEAAHRFEHEDPSHPFSRLHGHSFEGVVELRGAPVRQGGFVHDFWDVEARVRDAIADFDHSYLNDVADLESPSLENIALTIFRRLAPQLPNLEAVTIARPSCGESARVRRAAPGDAERDGSPAPSGAATP